MVAVVERDDGLAAGGVPGDLHRVLDRLRAGVEQRGALLVRPRRAPGQFLAHLDVTLVRGHHEAGVREPGRLLGHPRGHPGRRVAYRDHRDPGAEVDEGVAVGVHDDAAARVGDEHRQHGADPAGHRALAPGQQLA